MAPAPKSLLRRLGPVGLRWIGLVWMMCGAVAAHAADVLDREVNFHIASAPLSSALLEFSAQSGVQVAVADSDVSHVNSSALDGAYPIQQALSMLLHGTGLEFARVGADTVAIRSAAVAAAPPPAAAKAGGSAQFPDISVVTPRAPSAAELAGDSLYQFIVHHGTVHYVNTGVLGGLTRWRGGRPETICPKTVGLSPAYNAFVTTRLREVAKTVGAPVQDDPQCSDNVRILFTTQPDKTMSEILHWAAKQQGVAFTHQTQRELDASSGHSVQGWYITAGGGGAILNSDPKLLGAVELVPVWPFSVQNGLHYGGRFGGFISVILVIDTAKVAGSSIGAIADYVSMLALTMVQTPDHCDPLPSILDLMATNCGREKPTAITAGDLAFLRALYYHNTGLGSTLTRDEIQVNMTQQFKGQL